MRSHYCGELNATHVGEPVELCGWVHRRRDHGGVIFLDVRDRTGIVQVVYDPDTVESFASAERVRNEFVLRMTGRVRRRQEGAENPNMATGEVEVLGNELEILNAAETPPFQLDEYSEAGEDIRLRYRYLDLRRPEMQERLYMRAQAAAVVRAHLEENGYWEIETPTLSRSTPEGARDYLVPSRTHPGEFFALPQSPQMYKQLLMMSGVDKYYQLARCYRDEDLRHDRQPEFTQIDIEASFVREEDIMRLTESMFRRLFRELRGVELGDFPVMTWAEAMRDYGSDRPDLRNPLRLTDIADLMSAVEFKVFQGPANDPAGRVVALNAPCGGKLSRKVIDDFTGFVGRYGAKGLAYIKVNDLGKGTEGLQSPILKFLPEPVVAQVLERVGAQNGDLVFFGAGKVAGGERFHGRAAQRTRAQARAQRGGVRTPVGSGVAHVRTEPGRQPDARPPPVHPARLQPRGIARGARQGQGGGLRCGAERLRTRWRFAKEPFGRDAAGGAGGDRRRRRSRREVRFPARGAEARLPAPRRRRHRLRPAGDAAHRNPGDPRRYRLPEDPVGGLPDDVGAQCGRPGPVARPAHPHPPRFYGRDILS